MDEDKCRHVGPYFDKRLTANFRHKPDIVLTNNKTYINCHLKLGTLTPSDRIPILMTILINPIQIPIRP